MTLHARMATVAISVTLACVLSATPAHATVIPSEPYNFSDSFADVVCGVEVRHDVVESSTGHLRVGKGKTDQAFFTLDKYRATETLTSTANGNVVTIEHSQLTRDVKATRVSGNVFEFTTMFVGQPITIKDENGRVVARDRGVIRETYRFDTLGDSAPGGLPLGTIDVQVSGPHPFYESADFDATFCGYVRPLLLA